MSDCEVDHKNLNRNLNARARHEGARFQTYYGFNPYDQEGEDYTHCPICDADLSEIGDENE